MPGSASGGKLSERYYITMMVRLLVAQNEEHVQGDVINVATNTHHRFRGWEELLHTIRALAASSPHPGSDEPPT